MRLAFFRNSKELMRILSKDDSCISKLLPFSDHSFNDVKNTCAITTSTE